MTIEPRDRTDRTTATGAQLDHFGRDTVKAVAEIVWQAVFAYLDAQPEWTGATAGETAGRAEAAARAVMVDAMRLDGGPRELLAVARRFDRQDTTGRAPFSGIVDELLAANVDALPTD